MSQSPVNILLGPELDFMAQVEKHCLKEYQSLHISTISPISKAGYVDTFLYSLSQGYENSFPIFHINQISSKYIYEADVWGAYINCGRKSYWQPMLHYPKDWSRGSLGACVNFLIFKKAQLMLSCRRIDWISSVTRSWR